MNYAGPILAAEFRIAPALRFGLRSTRDNAALALQMTWPWVAILAGLELAARLPAGYPLSLLQPGGHAPAADPMLVGLLLIIKLMALASIAVSWSRFLLLGEVATGWDRLRIDRPVWRLAWNALLVWLACTGVFLLGAVLPLVLLPGLLKFAGYALPDLPRTLPAAGQWLEDPWAAIIAVSLVTGFLSGLPFVQRLSIKLTAIALEREDYGLGDAWRDSAGQPLRLVLFTFVTAAQVFAVWGVAFLVVHEIGGVGSASLVLGALAAATASVLSTLLATASVAVMFGMFVEGREV